MKTLSASSGHFRMSMKAPGGRSVLEPGLLTQEV